MNPIPLFTDKVADRYELDTPTSIKWFNEINRILPDSHNDYKWSCTFLMTVRNKDETFKKYRGAIEKLLLWAWLVKRSSISVLKPSDLTEMVAFYGKPPESWVSKIISRRHLKNGEHNTRWRPCIEQKNKNNSEAATKLLLAAVSAFYQFLIQENILEDNPAVAARKRCVNERSHTMNASKKILSKTQMSYLFDASRNMPYKDPYQRARARFLIAMFYYRYKRISELSPRKDYKGQNFTPIMGHIYRKDDDWFLKIPKGTSKGFSEQSITLPPELIEEIKVFRIAIGHAMGTQLTSMPLPAETTPLVPVILANGQTKGGLGIRMIRNIVNDVLKEAKRKLLEDSYDSPDAELLLYEAKALEEATTHWLRHTGVSADLENGRNIGHVRDDAMHKSISTTNIYIHTDEKDRANSAKKRPKNIY